MHFLLEKQKYNNNLKKESKVSGILLQCLLWPTEGSAEELAEIPY